MVKNSTRAQRKLSKIAAARSNSHFNSGAERPVAPKTRRPAAGSSGSGKGPRRSAKKESSRPTAKLRRRAAGGGAKRSGPRGERPVARRESRVTAAESRMAAVAAELALFDRTAQQSAFAANPFDAVAGHIDAAMTFLQPQTTDVGRRKTS